MKPSEIKAFTQLETWKPHVSLVGGNLVETQLKIHLSRWFQMVSFHLKLIFSSCDNFYWVPVRIAI